MHISFSCFLKAVFLTLFITFTSSNLSRAVTNTIPEELKPWIPWVLYNQEEKTCSLDTENSNKRYCSWPSRLSLDVKPNGAKFTQEWMIEVRSLVTLPGNSPFWPENIQRNGKIVPVSKHQGHPAIWLDPGEHTITGIFSWKSPPESLLIPPETGLVHLRLDGKNFKNPQIDQQGRLWFSKQQRETKNKQDNLSIQVFRKIEDGVPLIQHLIIRITVSGSPRQISLGFVVNEAPFIPLELNSKLPVRIDNKGRIQLQVRPGKWEVHLKLRNSSPLSPESLARGTVNGSWPEEEIWVFATNPKLRQIEVKGPLAIDPSRTSLPEKWKKYPAYLIKKDSLMTFHQKNRGSSNPIPNRLQLKRELWLDEHGTGITVKDNLSGTMTHGWRLDALPSLSLGKVEIEGRPRLITRLDSSEKIGVEVRQGSLVLHAESRIDKAVHNGRLDIPALGWDHDFQHLSAVLHLPPGWKLLTASGVDKVATWLNRWTLLDIFLVLITGLATARILGFGWGAVAIIFLLFSYHQPGAPIYFWLPLLALLSIQNSISSITGRRLCQAGGFALLSVIIINSIPYMINEVRVAIYPQLEHGSHYTIAQDHRMMTDLVQNDTDPVKEMQTFSMQPPPFSTKAIGKARRGYDYSTEPSSVQNKSKTKVFRIDPKELIQTGPGLPEWQWKRINLMWNGPVTPEQNIYFVFLSPRVNTILSFVRVLLLSLLVAGFIRRYLRFWVTSRKRSRTVSFALLFGLLFPLSVAPQTAQAEIPSQEILSELQNRLLQPPECGLQCATIKSCALRIDKDILTVELHLDALSRVAIPLPGKNRIFDTILFNSKKIPIIRLDEQGRSLLRVEAGSHTILLQKNLTGRDKFSFSFSLLPERGLAFLKNWTLNGLHDDGRLDHQITFNRNRSSAQNTSSTENDSNYQIPAFVQVERTIHMGLEWTVRTRIIRKSQKTVIAMDIPLLPGERVTTGSLYIQNDHVRINMGPKQNIFTYFSAMKAVDSLTLTAAKTTQWTEVWFLDVSPIWHLESKGFPEMNQTTTAGERYPEYRPYPGESLQLSISRPVGVPGPTITINRSKLTITPGLRSTETTLHFSLNASRGLQHSIALPAESNLQKTLINGQEFSLQLENNQLVIPIQPGTQNIEIGWRSKQEVDTKFITDSVDLGVESVNATIELNVPSSRWILLTGGPQIGPAVLFWGEMLVIILLALVLGRIKITPLSTLQWFFLSLGLSQLPAFLAIIVVAWLLLLGLRKNHGREIRSIITFNVMQVLLALLTLIALAVLFTAIQQGLLGHPDMQIGGNGSSGYTLRWYQDRSDSTLPTAWVITVPLIAYRICMLLWALWLAVVLLRWLRWGWACFSNDLLWKKPVPRKKIVPNSRRKTTGPPKATRGKKDITIDTGIERDKKTK